MGRVTDFELERMALGELPAGRVAELQALVAEDPEIAGRFDAISSHGVAFLEAHPPAGFVAGVRARHRAEQRRKWAAAGGGTLALAAVALLASMAVSDQTATPVVAGAEPIEEIRVKGPELRAFRQTFEGAVSLGQDAEVPPGSTIQLVIAQGAPQAAVFSVDGRGAITRHFPERGSQSAALGGGALPHAFTLDQVPDFERFFLVTSEQPFELAPIERSLADLGGSAEADLTLPETLHVHATLLRKVLP